MKKLLFACMFLCAFLFISNLSGQKIGGILVDDDDDAIENEEIELMVIVCKNGDSLFTKNDTVMTKDYGVFESDLTDDFKKHPVTNKDTISYQLKYKYRGEEIETEKKVWSNVRFASQASIADHASTADELIGLNGVLEEGKQGLLLGIQMDKMNYSAVEVPDDPGMQFLSNTRGDLVLETLDTSEPGLLSIDVSGSPGTIAIPNDGNSYNLVNCDNQN